MCGISGVLGSLPASDLASVAGRMASRLAHRGPDGQGVWSADGVALSHRRLAIIDPAAGHEPLSNEDGTVWITFNGEIYNFKSLREELQRKGHHFKTHCDTEVIVHGWEEWGEEIVPRLRGMFAFALYDTKRRSLFMARDRAGIKPLYYAIGDGIFAFASELQAFDDVPGIDRELDLDAIDLYLHFQYIPAPYTAFRGIRKLPAAHTLTVDATGNVLGPTRYWSLAFGEPVRLSEDDWIDRLDEVISESVRLHLVSDVPFGAFLSGGVDSSLVTAYMVRHLGAGVRTFSIAFDEADVDESEFSRLVAAHLGTTHTEKHVRADAFAILPRLVRHYGEPFADSSAIPTYYVSQAAAAEVKMVLSGDGGDEGFAGYLSYAGVAANFPPPVGKYRKMRFAAGNMARAFGLRPPLPNPDDFWFENVAYFGAQRRRSLWRHGVRPSNDAARAWFDRDIAANGPKDMTRRYQRMDLLSYLPYDILAKVDVASMCHSLEVRVPLLDHVVLETAASIPSSLKLKPLDPDDPRQGYEGKYILKKLASRLVPEAAVWRPKRGFGIPIEQWIVGPLNQFAEDYLLSQKTQLNELFEPAAMRQLVDDVRRGEGGAHRVWSLMFLEEWLRQRKETPAGGMVEA